MFVLSLIKSWELHVECPRICFELFLVCDNVEPAVSNVLPDAPVPLAPVRFRRCPHSPAGGPGRTQPLPEVSLSRAEAGLQQVDGFGGEEG